MAFNLSKYFENFGGLNFRTPELLKGSTVATAMANVRLSENFSLSKRRGYQVDYFEEAGGLVTFIDTDLSSGTSVSSRLIAQDTLYKSVLGTLSISHDTSINYSACVKLNTSTQVFEFILEDDNVEVLRVNLGTGSEITPVTNDDLVVAINAISGFNAYLLGSFGGDKPAATISTSEPIYGNLAAPPVSLQFVDKVKVNSPNSFIPFEDHWDNKTDPNWELNSFTQLHDVLYITNKYDGLMKYDGSLVYKAGLPAPNTLVWDNVATLVEPNWNYFAIFKHIDNKENVIQSRTSNVLTTNTTPTPDIQLDISNLLGAGYDTDDTRMSIELYRTSSIIGAQQVYYKVDTKVPSDAVLDIISFDNTDISDAALLDGDEYVFSPRENAVDLSTIKCSYLDVWRNSLVMTGNPTAPNTVYVADIERIEGFDLRNSFPTGSRFGGPNTGIRSLDNHLFVFKGKSITMVSGDISAGVENIQIDPIADDGVGSLSHHSIVEATGRIYFTSLNGIYSVNREGLRPESDDLTPIFTRPQFTQHRCISMYWVIENKILFLLPNSDGGQVLVKDLVANSWFSWEKFNFDCGITLDGQDVLIAGSGMISKVLDTKSILDYADHIEPIKFSYKSHWETLGEPAVYKKFLRMKAYTLDTDLQTFDSSNFSLDIKFQYDFNDVDVASVSMGFGAEEGAGYGEGPYGETSWGDDRKLEDTRRLADRRCRSMRVDIQNNNLHENILVSGFELEYVANFGPALKDGR